MQGLQFIRFEAKPQGLFCHIHNLACGVTDVNFVVDCARRCR